MSDAAAACTAAGGPQPSATASAAVAANAADSVTAVGASTSPAAKGGGADILEKISRLKHEQAFLREQKRLVSKQLKSEAKRMSRIKRRAKLLSDGDLLDLIRLRSAGEKVVVSEKVAGDSSESA